MVFDRSVYEKLVEKNEQLFVDELAKWVAIKSVSSDATLRGECFRMVDFVATILRDLGCQVEIKPNPVEPIKTEDGQLLTYPPILLASLTDKAVPEKKTLCIYGHLDVQPAKFSDGWKYEPFDMTIDDQGRMYGRGSSDDKGPVLGWICMLKTLKEMNHKPDMNLKFCFECMEESGSIGLEELIVQEKDKFFKGVDYVCISDNYWLGCSKPCITYGLRGICYFQIEMSGPNQDLHSGLFGGIIHEPLNDLVRIFGQLVDTDGKILIPDIYDQVKELTDDEHATYTTIDFDTDDLKKSVGVEKLMHDDKIKTLMNRWRYPSLSIHGFEGAFSDPGEKTVIPRKVVGKFSIRTVPHMTVDQTIQKTVEYLHKLHADLKSPTKMVVKECRGSPGWVASTTNANFTAARTAIKNVFNVEPDLTREGGSIPIALTFEEQLQRSVILLPMGRFDDGAHSQNEKLDISNYIMGIKLFGSYIHELSKLPTDL